MASEDRTTTFWGRRLCDGHHERDAQPGDYWRQPRGRGSVDGRRGKHWDWVVCDPRGKLGTLRPDRHEVEEHDDGTITVTPSIHAIGGEWEAQNADGVPPFFEPGGYHGWLKRGVWTDA